MINYCIQWFQEKCDPCFFSHPASLFEGVDHVSCLLPHRHTPQGVSAASDYFLAVEHMRDLNCLSQSFQVCRLIARFYQTTSDVSRVRIHDNVRDRNSAIMSHLSHDFHVFTSFIRQPKFYRSKS